MCSISRVQREETRTSIGIAETNLEILREVASAANDCLDVAVWMVQ